MLKPAAHQFLRTLCNSRLFGFELRPAGVISEFYRRVLTASALSFAAFAAIAISMPHPLSADPPAPSPISITDAFDPDLADLKPGAIKQLESVAKIAKDNAHCYPPRVTVNVGMKSGGDPLFLRVLGSARLNSVDAELKSLGLAEDQILNYPTFDLNGTTPQQQGAFRKWSKAVDKQVNIGADEYVRVSFEPPFNTSDNDPPLLPYVGSWPNPNTPVKPRQQIPIKIRSSERYDDGHHSWPSGDYKVKLFANEGPNGSDVQIQETTIKSNPCGVTIVTSYTVPAYPHDEVHLRVVAENANGQTWKEAYFPTGDFVAYLVKWSATGHMDTGWKPVEGAPGEYVRWKRSADVTGSALVRFKKSQLYHTLVPYDARYLSVSIHDTSESWTTVPTRHPVGACASYDSYSIADPHYSGAYFQSKDETTRYIVDLPIKQSDGFFVMEFTGYGDPKDDPGSTMRVVETDYAGDVACRAHRSEYTRNGPSCRPLQGGGLLRSRSPNDDSTFAARQWQTHGVCGLPGDVIVTWTAEAKRVPPDFKQ